MAGVQKQVGLNELKSQLQSKGLNEQEINSFMEFASKNPAEYGIEGAINMWRSVSGETTSNQNASPLDVIRQNQNTPQQAGVLNGQQPVKKSESDAIWDAVKNAGDKSIW